MYRPTEYRKSYRLENRNNLSLKPHKSSHVHCSWARIWFATKTLNRFLMKSTSNNVWTIRVWRVCKELLCCSCFSFESLLWIWNVVLDRATVGLELSVFFVIVLVVPLTLLIVWHDKLNLVCSVNLHKIECCPHFDCLSCHKMRDIPNYYHCAIVHSERTKWKHHGQVT